ncbi:hypothetical protein [Nocardia miyunensis]|uniref:hypothetical protein n=1 Tax=Nocardia miyunensis TaxID=282684 RepID=UPI000A836BD1|nr:hypothetical protein [Nocardia miyunensis]
MDRGPSRFVPKGRKYAQYELRTRYAGAPGYVPYEPIRDHIEELAALGLPMASIARDAGCLPNTVRNIRAGLSATVRIRQATAIRAVTVHPNERQQIVLAVGAMRRLQALHAIGWPWKGIAEYAPNVAAAVMSQMTRPRQGRTVIAWWTWLAIHDAYEQLSGTPGDSDRARRVATEHGWWAPLDWEGLDIDDPRVEPSAAQAPKTTTRDIANARRQHVRALLGLNLTTQQIADRVGVSERQAMRYLAEVRREDAA